MKTTLLFLTIIISTSTFVSQNLCQKNKQHHCRHNIHTKTGAADNLRSDTIDILNYNTLLDITDFTTDTISGHCTITFKSKIQSISSISLDLLQMEIDSITDKNGNLLSYSYNDTLIIASLNSNLLLGDTTDITVYYYGKPQQDASAWGGWYNQGNYSYNLGVGFDADPHNYGRVWHPCFDNFVERATYDFEIITNNSKTAYCNGILIDTTTIFGNLHSIWSMQESIPTYLATIAVAPYTHVEQDYISSINSDTIPVYLIAEASDTSNLKSSFTNLHGAISIFENSYSPYYWNKVGFYLVPFSGGAMEHATAIAYPKITANGSTSYETLMAHELSHHWWGNLVTCRTDEDMWINEGMASYSEFLFLENIYGYDSYINEVKLNHKDVLHHAHINDNSYLPLHGVPHTYTYGDHSYNKGASVAHTLRGYLGDSLFFLGLNSVLINNAFTDIDAYDFRDELNNISGIDVTDFFDDWIFGTGFTHFSIDSVISSINGNNYDIEVFIKQKLRGTNTLYNNIPLEITFVDSIWQKEDKNFIMNGIDSSFIFTLAFNPKFAYLNGNDKISQAVTGENITINSSGAKNLSYSMCRITTNSIIDSSLLRIEHHWAAPDGFKNASKYFMYELSEERYWKIDGILSSNFSSKIRLFFNGTNSPDGNLDNNLTSISGFHEDSIQLFYRKNTNFEWEPLELSFQQSLGSKTDGYGFVEIDTLMLGEYTWGWKKSSVGLNNSSNRIKWNIYPNPTNGKIVIDIPKKGELNIYDIHGRLTKSYELNKNTNNIILNLKPKGIYLFVYNSENISSCKKVVIE